MIGTGGGGKASEKGVVCEVLIPKLRSAAERCCVDVVLVTQGRDAYSAAQRSRKELVTSVTPGWRIPDVWKLGPHTPELLPIAEDLAQSVRDGELVLFFGAGVSTDAGVPGWQELLDRVAGEIGLSGQLDQLRKHDLRDQAALLDRQLALKKKQRISDRVVEYTTKSRYALAHGLLASLRVREAVTTNFDRLYESAVQGGVSVLPNDSVDSSRPWLLKLHGSNEDAANIVLTREHYLEMAKRWSALLGLLQAMLLTRKMLFVGYSLSDEDFHLVINDVRLAAPGNKNLRVAITLFHDQLFEQLWEHDIKIAAVSTAEETKSETGKAEASRRVLVLLDLVAYLAADLNSFLLKPGYIDMLTPDEKDLAAALEQLAERVPAHGDGSGWRRVRSFLEDFGWSGPT
jgi:hypothetical protein